MLHTEERVVSARNELLQIGVRELRTVEEVDSLFADPAGTKMIIFNSMCGCTARNARPAVAAVLEDGPRPDQVVSVFAGQDLEATEKVRKYLLPQPPSSPCIALLKDGRLVFILHREQIEGRRAEAITNDLREALTEYCN